MSHHPHNSGSFALSIALEQPNSKCKVDQAVSFVSQTLKLKTKKEEETCDYIPKDEIENRIEKRYTIRKRQRAICVPKNNIRCEERRGLLKKGYL